MFYITFILVTIVLYIHNCFYNIELIILKNTNTNAFVGAAGSGTAPKNHPDYKIKDARVLSAVGRCRRNMVGSLPRGMPKVVDYRQTGAQVPNKMVTQDRHEVLSRFGRQKGVIPMSCV